MSVGFLRPNESICQEFYSSSLGTVPSKIGKLVLAVSVLSEADAGYVKKNVGLTIIFSFSIIASPH